MGDVLLSHALLSSFMGTPYVLRTRSSSLLDSVSLSPHPPSLHDILSSTNNPGRTPSDSLSWYTDSVTRPVKTLKARLRAGFGPTFHVNDPSDRTSTCPLVAVENLVGRALNGVLPANLCGSSNNAEAAHTEGIFIHIEQASISRQLAAYAQWVTAVSETFTTV